MDRLESIEKRLAECMLADEARLRSRLRRIRRQSRQQKPVSKATEQLERAAEASCRLAMARQDAQPQPEFPADLPISAMRDEIAAALQDNQVLVVCGETGSGKSTQLPKICLSLGRGIRGMIGHTQPRRIAARSIAARIADELNVPLGREVGYKVRFGDAVRDTSLIKVMTDGILLAEIRHDPDLRQYDTIIIDEAHERSLNIDFLIGYLHRLLPRRSDLKVVITSATIDPQRFGDHFGDAPIIEVSGRTYPVDVQYRPPVAEDPDMTDPDLVDHIRDVVVEIAARDEGDMLIFLSGEREIREVARLLRGTRLPGAVTEVLPLYSRLSAAEQNKVFQPHKGRRIVLATNVAETSLTVPGIRYVIDPGLARVSRYSARSQVQRLPIEPISRASADQRKGRCGRVQDGICVRLYSEQDFEQRERFTSPEILRTNLASVILQMKALRLGAIEDFPFVEPPRAAMVRDGYEVLYELGALDQWGELTDLGRQLAKLPIDPRLGRMVLQSCDEGCLHDVVVIASALSIQDPRERPHEAQEKADEVHRRFSHEQSDFMSLLSLWSFWHEQSRRRSGSQLRRLCKQSFLSYVRMREWQETYHQLMQIVIESGLEPAGANRNAGKYDAIHRSLLSGLLSRVGVKGDHHEYAGAHGRKFFVFPGSSLFARLPRWIMAAELVETTKLYARMVARINPQWIEALAPHLLKRHHRDPYFEPKSAQIMAFERVTLFGVEIVSRRRVPYGPIDPVVAREMFIHHALVEGDTFFDAPFFQHNLALINDIRRAENKIRRRDFFLDEQTVYEFYDRRIPAGVFDRRRFQKWRRKTEKRDPRLLFMAAENLLFRSLREVTPEQFPDEVRVRSTVAPLEYRFEPGHPEDGVTMVVPPALLHQLSAARLEWLVPGLITEKVAAMIRALPKDLRRNFVPAPDYARAVVSRVRFGEGDLREALSRELRAMSGCEVPREAWAQHGIPEHLRMKVKVVDDQGEVLATSADLDRLREMFVEESAPVASTLDTRGPDEKEALNGEMFADWTFGDLQEQCTVERSGITMHLHPGVADRGSGVCVRLFDSPEQAAHATWRGVRRLIMLRHPEEVELLVNHVSDLEGMAVTASGIGLGDEAWLRGELAGHIVDQGFLAGVPMPRTREAFERLVQEGWHRTAEAAARAGTLLKYILALAQEVQLRIGDLRGVAAFAPAATEMRDHLGVLLHRRFLSETPIEWLAQFPRYLKGTISRIEKLTNGRVDRDRELAEAFEPRWRACLELLDRQRSLGRFDPALEVYRWLLEEYRVATFAQELGTIVKVSPQRLEACRQRVAI